MILRCMSYLKGDLLRQLTVMIDTCGREHIEVMETEIFPLHLHRFVTLGDIQDIIGNVLLDHVPRPTAKAQAMTLSDGMKPQSFMFA